MSESKIARSSSIVEQFRGDFLAKGQTIDTCDRRIFLVGAEPQNPTPCLDSLSCLEEKRAA